MSSCAGFCGDASPKGKAGFFFGGEKTNSGCMVVVLVPSAVDVWGGVKLFPFRSSRPRRPKRKLDSPEPSLGVLGRRGVCSVLSGFFGPGSISNPSQSVVGCSLQKWSESNHKTGTPNQNQGVYSSGVSIKLRSSRNWESWRPRPDALGDPERHYNNLSRVVGCLETTSHDEGTLVAHSLFTYIIYIYI